MDKKTEPGKKLKKRPNETVSDQTDDTTSSGCEESKARKVSQTNSKKPRAYKKWKLSEDGKVNARCGLIDNEVILRISCEPVLTEDRPQSPPTYRYTEIEGKQNKDAVSSTIFLSVDEFEEFERLIDVVTWNKYPTIM